MENSVNQRVKLLRQTLMYSLNAFAKLLDVSPTAIQKIENGGGISMRLQKKIIETFNVNPNWLLHGQGDMFIQEVKTSESIKSQLIKFQGILIGKLGEKTWKELDPYFPKCRQAV